MGKNEKMIVKKLEGIHVRRDGITYQLIFGELGVMALKQEEVDEPPTAFFWDWSEAARMLAQPNMQGRSVSLKPDPHAQPGGVPGVSSPK